MKKYSNVYDVNESLIFAIIKAESSFNPHAQSSKGAIGLMQIMEDTAKWLSHDNQHIDLENIDINIMYGTMYLRYLMDKYNNSILEVLASYNAGEGNVDKWIADKKVKNNINNIEFTLNDIMYTETRHYVIKVIKYQNYYRFLYNLE